MWLVPQLSIIVVLLVAVLVEIRRWRREVRTQGLGDRRPVRSPELVAGERRRRKR